MEGNGDNHIYSVKEIRLQEVVCRLFGKQRGDVGLLVELHTVYCLSDRVPFVVEKEGSTPLKPREIGRKELLGDVISLRGLLRARQCLHTVGADTFFIVNHSPAHRAAPREEKLEDTMENGEGQGELRVECLVLRVESAAKVVNFGDIYKG